MRYVGQVSCIDTMTGTEVMVDVNEQVEEYIKRSYWREEKQRQRYYARKLDLMEIEYSKQFESSIEVEIVKREESETVQRCLAYLGERERFILIENVVAERSLTDIARQLNLSLSYVSKLNKKAIKELKSIYERTE